MKTDSFSNQLRWVILLLAAAVILPTVCLLWFMNQAVRNERLAVRQKLVDLYTKRAQFFFTETQNKGFNNHLNHLKSAATAEPWALFERFSVDPQTDLFQGLLIYDSDGILLYPSIAFQLDEEPAESGKPFPDKSKESIDLAYQLSYPDNPETISPLPASDVMRYRVFLAKCLLETNDERLFSHLRRVLGNSHYNNEKENGFLIGPAETTIWQLEKLIAIASQAGLADRLTNEIRLAQNRIRAYENAIASADLYPSTDHFQGWQNQTIRRLTPGSDHYGFKYIVADKTILGISTYERLLGLLVTAAKDMLDDTVEVQISDNFGDVIIGDVSKTEKPFVTLKAGNFLPDFTVSVFFKDTSVFEKAAHRQTSIYIWTGVLVALLILSAGGISIRTVNHQIKMNRLKNDFIATVTHELKTPLASMRLLVDTLLEGNYESEQTATEYLQMVANENERLTHLIDSFLTFSRMERNKQVFDITAVSPVEVAKIASEAVRAKFENGNVIFDMDVQKSLPMMVADKDGIITAIVNLLDNAYKYTNGDKRIELKVYKQNGFVCFAVKDNGIGLSARAQKKIFNRFYQVDSRLSRRNEGCGLGLSIVKFIIDAHKGSIEVESAPGKGSTFIMKLPCCKG